MLPQLKFCMKLLLDECVTYELKKLLSDLEVSTVAEMGFKGLKNGKLLKATEEAGFDILLTIDKNIDYQQNISKFHLTIVVFDVFRSNIKYLEELLPLFRQQLPHFQKGQSYRIKKT